MLFPLVFRSICTTVDYVEGTLVRKNSNKFVFSLTYPCVDYVESRLHLGNTQINLVFRSICTTFAPRKQCTHTQVHA